MNFVVRNKKIRGAADTAGTGNGLAYAEIILDIAALLGPSLKHFLSETVSGKSFPNVRKKGTPGRTRTPGENQDPVNRETMNFIVSELTCLMESEATSEEALDQAMKAVSDAYWTAKEKNRERAVPHEL